ncbi:RHS repeat-associated core domain-containing protein [Pseudomonas sp. NPDC088890]|uniref:RHS repeat-associated core domain-containing protein n=1 Tax=Pseudomonas sp. NPDC088890 TaxID=3364458 RepID=UPI00384AFF44
MATQQLLATDRLLSPFMALGATGRSSNAYTPYGYCPAKSTSPLLGFTGQLREPDLGWYLLGNGYRAFNTKLMRFHSPDRLSPFGKGGINAYAYCEGDPVNWQDFSGRNRTRKRSFSRSAENISDGNNRLAVEHSMNMKLYQQLHDVDQGRRNFQEYVNKLSDAIVDTEYLVKADRSPSGDPHSGESLKRLTELAQLYMKRAEYDNKLLALEFEFNRLNAQLESNARTLREIREIDSGYDDAIHGIEKRLADETPPAYAWRKGSL